MAILKKLKKGLKKAAKVAIPVGAAFLAAKAMKNKKDKADLGSTEDGKGGIDTILKAKQAMTSNDAYNDDTMPGNLSKNMGMKPKRRNMYSPNDFGLGPYDGAKKGGSAGKDFGKKKKSMGKALRGGGRVMR